MLTVYSVPPGSTSPQLPRLNDYEIANKAKRKRGYTFSKEEAKALIGTRIRAKTSFNMGLMQKGEAGTVTGVRKQTSSNGRVSWEVEITWDVMDNGYLRGFSKGMFRANLEVVNKQLRELP